MYIVSDGSYNASSAPSVKLHTYRCIFTLNATRILTTDEYFMEEAQEGGLIYGKDVNVYNQETPYASGRNRLLFNFPTLSFFQNFLVETFPSMGPLTSLF